MPGYEDKVIMAAGTVICMAASAPLIGLFSSNPETIAIGQTALRIICLGFVVSAVSTTSSGALEGLGKGAASLVISLCRYVIFIMPLAWLLCRQLGPTGVWHAFWVTEVLSAVIADAVLWGAAYWLVSYEPELIRVITPDVMLLVSVSVLIFGVLITWLCALLSINKYLKMKAGTLYYI